MTAQILYCHPPQNQPPTKHSADDTDSHLSLKTKPINLCSELCSSGHHQTFLLICEFNFGTKGSKFYTNDNSSHMNIVRTKAKIKVFYTSLYKSLYKCTPPRTPRISRLKSQIMKPTFLS